MIEPDSTGGARRPRAGSRTRPARRGIAGIAGIAAVTLGVGSALVALSPAASMASSHREAPLVAADPAIDNTDTYAFVSPDDKNSVTLVANWIPFEDPNGGPNFYPFANDAQYDINIDNDGDAKPDITYRWTFSSSYKNPNTFLYNTGVVTSLDDPDLNFTQTYRLEVVSKGRSTVLADKVPVAPSNVGKTSMPNYAALRNQAVKPLPSGLTTFAGQADDPFFLDLHVFDLLYGGNLSEIGKDTLAGYNVNSIALKVPASLLALKGDAGRNPVVGVWSTTQRRSTTMVSPTNSSGRAMGFGQWSQVSRLGSPLVNEVIIPVGQKDRFNASTPSRDAQFLNYVTDPELARLFQTFYKIPAPKTPRNDLVAVFLTGISKANLGVDLTSPTLNADADPKDIAPSEELRLNMSVPPTASPNRLGVVGGDAAGFPNGRRLTDDVVDVELQAVEGVLLPGTPDAVKGLGDAVNANNIPFLGTFPYLALPNSR
ncbi:DUF4331 domain-containing protein [Frankia sp. Cas4]|uniref:DUF4331 domain-containing protein n=1 Tax=Frankia sp. Cas4 TaxID=3073927 RepID=UPI002AD39BD7|nr:DUF4331 domain-containing protein [Frankia sp. Cas4]